VCRWFPRYDHYKYPIKAYTAVEDHSVKENEEVVFKCIKLSVLRTRSLQSNLQLKVNGSGYALTLNAKNRSELQEHIAPQITQPPKPVRQGGM